MIDCLVFSKSKSFTMLKSDRLKRGGWYMDGYLPGQCMMCCVHCRANPVPNSNGGAGGAWPLNTGNDFLPNHLANGIDYGSIHMWPDNWGRTDLGFGK